MRSTDRLSLGILKGKIIRALGKMRAGCEALNYQQAIEAEKELNAYLDDLSRRLRVG